MPTVHDVICVGGGVIGLLTARELRLRGASVCVVDRSDFGLESSWAGAGIVPPPGEGPRASPLEHLREESFNAFPVLSREIRDATAIDIGFRRSGGMELAESAAEANELAELSDLWRDLKIQFQVLDRQELQRVEPSLSGDLRAAYHVPEMCQVRNPRFMKGLRRDLELRGATLLPREQVTRFLLEGSRVSGVELASGTRLVARDVVLAAGAWSSSLLEGLGIQLPVRPVQGQIVAFQTEPGRVTHVIMLGKRYFVPRDDGLLLVGSTEEDVGFVKQVTESGLAELRAFAYRWFPFLRETVVKASWAGLRPGNDRDYPIVCRVPGYTHLWLGTGHFRQGIQLGPGSARLLADWITEQASFAGPDDFGLGTPLKATRVPFRS
ncbi:MAG: glycine oxidase ThiO [Planctomycetota bacterium]